MSSKLQQVSLYLIAIIVLVLLASLMADPELAFKLLTPAILIGFFGVVRGLWFYESRSTR